MLTAMLMAMESRFSVNKKNVNKSHHLFLSLFSTVEVKAELPDNASHVLYDFITKTGFDSKRVFFNSVM